MLGFIIGSMLGGAVGVVTTCLCVVSSRDDDLNSRDDPPYTRIK